jgi:predicted amidohydrolase
LETRGLTVAIAHDVFVGEDGRRALESRARDAVAEGAELLLLPELPLTEWVPATREVHERDAEPPDGPSHLRMADIARSTGIGLHGGAIVRDPRTESRRNRALLYDRTGRVLCQYDKLHVPCEPGFWEADHYETGDGWTPPCEGFGLSIGLQICSDAQRPTVWQALSAMGAELILAPRATPVASYERWRTVLRANAVTSAVWVVSVNRPRPERGVPIGGPSLVIAPDGSVVVETEAPLTVVTLDSASVRKARRDYPGYLPVRSELYARVWARAAGKRP